MNKLTLSFNNKIIEKDFDNDRNFTIKLLFFL